MSKPKFTPGPWTLLINVLQQQATISGCTYNGGMDHLATLSAGTDERVANAVLFTAAPEMYYFIHNLIELNNAGKIEDLLLSIALADETILKEARGES